MENMHKPVCVSGVTPHAPFTMPIGGLPHPRQITHYTTPRRHAVDHIIVWRYDREWCRTSLKTFTLFFLIIVFPLLCGVDVRCHTPPCSTVVHFLPTQSLLFDIGTHSVQPSSLRPSSLPSHRPPSYVVLLSSHHMPILLQPPSRTLFSILILNMSRSTGT